MSVINIFDDTIDEIIKHIEERWSNLNGRTF